MIFPLQEQIPHSERAKVLGQNSVVIWITGLSGSGKTTIALRVEKELTRKGFKAYLLDGDTLRDGLNKDLGFSTADRKESIRRIAEVCRIMNNAGLIVITSFISPFERERKFARKLIRKGEFVEVHANASLEVCEERDVKGLYEKARQGLIPDFTGIGSPYEPPVDPELILETGTESEDESLQKLLRFIEPLITIR